MKLPDFIIGGAGKCGTTSLAWYLGQHPQIFVSRMKELQFFNNDQLYSKGLSWYARHFAEAGEGMIAGEASPNYLAGDYIAERIAKDLPNVKMIFLFRDPVKRAYSNYWHAMRGAADLGPFETCVDDPRCAHFWEKSRYAKYLETYINLLGRNRIHCLLTEQMGKDTDATLRDVFRFLGVDENVTIERSSERRNTHYVPRYPALQRWAYKHVRPTNSAVETQVFDEEGRLANQKRRKSFFWARKAAMRVIGTINRKEAVYPPLDEGLAAHLRPMFAEDNARLVELTGLPIEEYWPGALEKAPQAG